MARRGKKLPVDVTAVHSTLNETLHAVRPVPVLPLLLSLDVDHRKSSVKSSVSAL